MEKVRRVAGASISAAQHPKAVSEEGFERGLDALAHTKDSDKPTTGGERPATTNGRIPKVKKASTTPTASQLKRSAVRARKAGVPELAEKYDKVAADTARYEALAREHGADLSEEGFNEILKKVAHQK